MIDKVITERHKMLFNKQYHYTQYDIHENQLVEFIVNDELPNGELEQLQQKIDMLTDIVGFLVSGMSPEQIKEFANYFGMISND